MHVANHLLFFLFVQRGSCPDPGVYLGPGRGGVSSKLLCAPPVVPLLLLPPTPPVLLPMIPILSCLSSILSSASSCSSVISCMGSGLLGCPCCPCCFEEEEASSSAWSCCLA